MEKNKLIELKKRLVSLGLAGVMLTTTGCHSQKEETEPAPVSSSDQNLEECYKYVIQNGEAVKLYNSTNIYILFNKETYEISEYIYYIEDFLGGLGTQMELYDLQSEEILSYCDGISYWYNEALFNDIVENNYQVCLTDVSDYIEGHISKEYYSLDEIRKLEPQIEEGLKIINYAKTRNK